MKNFKNKSWLVIAAFVVNVLAAMGATYNLTGTTGSRDVQYATYTNYMDEIWYINTGTSKPVAIEVYLNIDPSDFLRIYSIDDAGAEVLLFSSTTSTLHQEFVTIYTNGKAKIEFIANSTISYADGYTNYTGLYFVYNSASTSYLANGNATIAGNLGIGMTTPQTRLHINGAIRGTETEGALKVNTTNGNLRLGYTTNYDITTDRSYFLFDKAIRTSNGQIGSTSNLSLQTNGTTRMTVLNSNGNVGINATSPYQALTVKGNISVYPTGTTAIESYNGSLMITKPAASGQYINLSRTGSTSWSVGTVYNTNTFAIGQANSTDASFTSPAFNITTAGNVGIGTIPTTNKLEVASTNGYGIRIGKIGDVGNLVVGMDSVAARYNIDFSGYRDIVPDQIGARITALRFNHGAANNALVQSTGLSFSTNPTGYYSGTTGLVEQMRIMPNGNVGIGTTRPAFKLDVKGTIRATEVRVVSAVNFADFVFNKDYKLPKLSEVGEFIQANGHLPNIPSAKEVKENGLSLVDMQVKLLQKVEELTLYALDQQKRLEAQQARIDKLEKELRAK